MNNGYVYISQNAYNVSEEVVDNINIDEATSELKFVYYHKLFKYSNIESNFNVEVKFTFPNTAYNLKSSNGLIFLEKQYGQLITEQEIKEFVDMELRHHKSFIEDNLRVE